jgi:hypothetical protein
VTGCPGHCDKERQVLSAWSEPAGSAKGQTLPRGVASQAAAHNQ